jgi:hypothetical protein
VINGCQVTANFKQDVRRAYQLLHLIFTKLTILFHKIRFFHQSLVYNLKNFLNLIFNKYFPTFQLICNLFLRQRTLPPIVTEWNQSISPPPPPPSPPTVKSQAPLLTCGSCWTAAHGIISSSYSWQLFLHPHTQWFISQLELTVSCTEIL